ncbi:MAG: MotA/TolQ/ExbB proton channel family protein [Desulfamplus sp.]|nr:MotA/TolQ/ExbB proton channel family protein [Desulfamplus sp.]
MFTERGIVPFVIVFFFWWSLAVLFIKWRKLVFQKRALTLMVVPQSRDFELNQDSARDILSRMYGLVDDPRHFVLLNRIERALANLHNIGMIADVSAVLHAQARNDEDQMESSYGLVKGFVWAIPVLGFIGTVLGLSRAIGNFGTVISSSDGLETLRVSLQAITSGLAVAFDTTLIALAGALCVQLIMVALKKKEEGFLDECNDYCHANIISKLRLSDH